MPRPIRTRSRASETGHRARPHLVAITPTTPTAGILAAANRAMDQAIRATRAGFTVVTCAALPSPACRFVAINRTPPEAA